MKNRTYLMLLEQLVMILVFAAAAAVCMRVFVYSYQISGDASALSEAALLAQNTAEQIKAARGTAGLSEQGLYWNGEESCWEASYDERWQPTAMKTEKYRMTVCPENASGLSPGIAGIRIWEIGKESRELLFELTVAWQEEINEG